MVGPFVWASCYFLNHTFAQLLFSQLYICPAVIFSIKHLPNCYFLNYTLGQLLFSQSNICPDVIFSIIYWPSCYFLNHILAHLLFSQSYIGQNYFSYYWPLLIFMIYAKKNLNFRRALVKDCEDTSENTICSSQEYSDNTHLIFFLLFS